MDRPQAKREEDIAECLDEWEDKCSKLARHGSEYVLPDMYKTAALQKILVGQAKNEL